MFRSRRHASGGAEAIGDGLEKGQDDPSDAACAVRERARISFAVATGETAEAQPIEGDRANGGVSSLPRAAHLIDELYEWVGAVSPSSAAAPRREIVMRCLEGGEPGESFRAENITRLHPANPELRVGIWDVSFSVPFGESLALIGREDSGVATVIAAISGTEDLDGGSVSVGGEPLVPGDVVDMNADLLLPGDAVGGSLVSMLRARHEKHRPDLEDWRVHRKVQLAFENAGCVQLMDRRPDELTRLERAEALGVVVLALEPKVIVAHEPDRGLCHRDAHVFLEGFVASAEAAGCALVYSTQHLSHAKTTHMWLMRDGHATDLLRTRPKLRVLA